MAKAECVLLWNVGGGGTLLRDDEGKVGEVFTSSGTDKKIRVG